MRGTQNHEGIAGAGAAVDYLATLGREVSPGGRDGMRRAAVLAAFDAIAAHEAGLSRAVLHGLAELPAIRLWGVRDPDRVSDRTPTFALTHAERSPREMAQTLAAAGIFAWPGNSYAVHLSTALGLEPEGVLRVGMLHYNTLDEVERLLQALREL
jgi:selenocysteine lyase/cysteine desulfurase